MLQDARGAKSYIEAQGRGQRVVVLLPVTPEISLCVCIHPRTSHIFIKWLKNCKYRSMKVYDLNVGYNVPSNVEFEYRMNTLNK